MAGGDAAAVQARKDLVQLEHEVKLEATVALCMGARTGCKDRLTYLTQQKEKARMGDADALKARVQALEGFAFLEAITLFMGVGGSVAPSENPRSAEEQAAALAAAEASRAAFRAGATGSRATAPATGTTPRGGTAP